MVEKPWQYPLWIRLISIATTQVHCQVQSWPTLTSTPCRMCWASRREWSWGKITAGSPWATLRYLKGASVRIQWQCCTRNQQPPTRPVTNRNEYLHVKLTWQRVDCVIFCRSQSHQDKWRGFGVAEKLEELRDNFFFTFFFFAVVFGLGCCSLFLFWFLLVCLFSVWLDFIYLSFNFHMGSHCR